MNVSVTSEKLAAFEARIGQLTDDTRRTEGQHDQLVLELTDLAATRDRRPVAVR